jgi:hypothetical protein
MPTVADIIQEIAEVGVVNSRLSSNYLGWLNRAQRWVCGRRNWNFCFDYQQFTLVGGTSSFQLGPSFKALAPERSPVSYIAPGGGAPITVNISSRAQLSRFWTSWTAYFYTPNTFWLPPTWMFLEQDNNGQWTLNLPPSIVAQNDITYGVSAYYFPADFTSGSNTNGLTTHPILIDALINYTKALAYWAQDPTDQRGAAARTIAEQAMTSAAYDDVLTRSSGRAIHM